MYCICVYYTALTEHIKVAVVDGQRPNMAEIKGPEHFEEFARTCIERCWNGEPEERPTFGGENCFHHAYAR